MVGAGAVGGYYGAMLSEGHSVSVVARGAHGAALREQGLALRVDGEPCPTRFEAVYPSLAEAQQAAAFDYVLLAVKGHQLAPELSAALLALPGEPWLVSLLNGIESEALLAEAGAEGRVIAGVARVAAERGAAGEVEVLGQAAIELAPWGSTPETAVVALAQAFRATCVETTQRPDARQMLWHKLLWNVPFNGLCALLDRTATELLELPRLRQEVAALIEEVCAVARAEGVPLAEGMAAKTIAYTEARFERIIPSMLQDRRAGRPLEWDGIQGALLRAAERHGVPTPRTALLAAMLCGLTSSETEH